MSGRALAVVLAAYSVLGACDQALDRLRWAVLQAEVEQPPRGGIQAPVWGLLPQRKQSTERSTLLPPAPVASVRAGGYQGVWGSITPVAWHISQGS